MFESKNNGKFIDFIKRQGFYIALVVCILAVGVISFFAVNATPGQDNEGQNVQKQEAPGLQEEIDARNSALPSALPSATPQASAEPSPSPSPSPTKRAAQRVLLQMPLEGEIIRAFSDDTLVFNATLNMWMTHNGIDISAAKSKDVTAALAGTVAGVERDATKGMIVTVEHGKNSRTVYVGLSGAKVAEGDKVNAGTLLGTAGTPGFEAAEGDHLHFEYVVNGSYVDPAAHMAK